MKLRPFLFCLLAAGATAAPPKISAKTQTAARLPRQRFIRGTVISVNAKEHMLVIRLDGIPGYMSAMTMRYDVALQEDLKRILPGDRIEANEVGSGPNIHLEKINVIARRNDKDNTK
jgi:Cu/Ag efflux protein CusF